MGWHKIFREEGLRFEWGSAVVYVFGMGLLTLRTVSTQFQSNQLTIKLEWTGGVQEAGGYD